MQAKYARISSIFNGLSNVENFAEIYPQQQFLGAIFFGFRWILWILWKCPA